MRLALLAIGFVIVARAQPGCPPTPAYSICDLVFEMNDAEAAANPTPYTSVTLQAEFRSPRHRTFLMPGFWDGGRRLVIRFTPTDPGDWDYRITSSIERFNGLQGKVSATASDAPGFIQPANVQHWRYSESLKAHLWMGDTCYTFASIDRKLFEALVEGRARQKFNHIRGIVLGRETEIAKAYPAADRPEPAFFQELDQRIRFMNEKGITADLVLGHDSNQLTKLFPNWRDRERYIRYLVARYAPMNITWQGVQEFEEYDNGRELLKEIGGLLKKLDPYQHPRSTHTIATSAPLLADGWMDYIVYQSSDDQLGAVEHQLYPNPAVNAEFAYEDSGAGKSHAHHVDTDTFRKRLWNATMNGQYPTFGNTGTYGGRKFEVDLKYLDSPGAQQMTHWFDFFSKTRHWELQPYFDVDGGRALALDDRLGREAVEYIVYVEKPTGPIEVLVEKRGYDIAWFNPISGEYIPQKDWKGERFVGEPPSRDHDWVLHISREGRKQSMLNSYKFESRPTVMQEVERSPQRVPFEVVEPAAEDIPVKSQPKYSVKIKRETRATRSMMYLWTGEAPAEGQGYRVLGTGAQGVLRFPPGLAKKFPAVINLRVTALNANGKAYSIDRVYRLTQ